jgi:hypothetical protein
VAAIGITAARAEDKVKHSETAKAIEKHCATEIGVCNYAGEAKVNHDEGKFKNVSKEPARRWVKPSAADAPQSKRASSPYA